MLFALRELRFSLHQMQLVTCENIDGTDTLFLIFEQVALLDPRVELLFTQRLAQQLREIFRLSFTIVHQLQERKSK